MGVSLVIKCFKEKGIEFDGLSISHLGAVSIR